MGGLFGNPIELFPGKPLVARPVQPQQSAILDDRQALPKRIVQPGRDSLSFTFLKLDQPSGEVFLGGLCPPELVKPPFVCEHSDSNQAQDCRAQKPPRAVERRNYPYTKGRAFKVPNAVRICCYDPESIIPRRQVGVVSSAARPNVKPVAVQTIQPAPEIDIGGFDEAERGEVDFEVPSPRRNLDDSAALHGFSIYAAGLNDDLGRLGVERYVVGIDDRHTCLRGEPELAVAGFY